jgi:membrane-bound ClpP family serine protease
MKRTSQPKIRVFSDLCSMPDAALLASLTLLAGLFLLSLEMFVPSLGLLLVMSLISLAVSFWSACKAWWGVSPHFFWSYVLLLLGGIPTTFFGSIAVLQRTSLGKRLTLTPPPDAGKPPANPLQELIGRTGIAQTLMTPGGMVVIDGQRLHAESTGMPIEPGTAVLVVAVRASRIVVRKSGDVPQAQDSPARRSTEPLSGRTVLPAALDFDIPAEYTQ